jgi:hypothetical protein
MPGGFFTVMSPVVRPTVHPEVEDESMVKMTGLPEPPFVVVNWYLVPTFKTLTADVKRTVCGKRPAEKVC